MQNYLQGRFVMQNLSKTATKYDALLEENGFVWLDPVWMVENLIIIQVLFPIFASHSLKDLFSSPASDRVDRNTTLWQILTLVPSNKPSLEIADSISFRKRQNTWGNPVVPSWDTFFYKLASPFKFHNLICDSSRKKDRRR